MKEVIHIAIPAVGDAYRFYAEVTAESARRGSSLLVEVHYLDWSTLDRTLVERLGDWHGSAITWSRLWLPELFPELDWVVSADADVMFRGDIAELWRLRDERHWVLASRDNPMPGEAYNQKAISWYRDRGLRFDRPEEYFCAGLTLFNLKAMREGGWAKMRDEFLAVHDATSMPNADQCVLNYLLQEKKSLLPRGWGVFSGDENADIDWTKAGAVHFVEDMPWNRHKVTHLMSDLVMEWWKIAEGFRFQVSGFRGCRNWFDYAWRRAVFLLLKHNQWILKLHPKLRLHLRSTRGVRV